MSSAEASHTGDPQWCGSGRKWASTEGTHSVAEYVHDHGEEGKRTEEGVEEENEK